MGIKINKEGIYVDAENPNIFLGPAFIKKDNSLIQKIPKDNFYLQEDTRSKVQNLV